MEKVRCLGKKSATRSLKVRGVVRYFRRCVFREFLLVCSFFPMIKIENGLGEYGVYFCGVFMLYALYSYRILYTCIIKFNSLQSNCYDGFIVV